jgi:hypothetical protein
MAANFTTTAGSILGSIAATSTAIEATADALATNAQAWAATSKANLDMAIKAAPEHARLKQAAKMATARNEVVKQFKSTADLATYQDALDFFK